MEDIKIIILPISKIHPHPENPRKDLGDLTELADSIKTNGILQNLTVVPLEGEEPGSWDGENYQVVIGHRRLAASELAGLTEVPCVVAEMTYAEQIRTMLMENMQRSDLTVYEQAQGFQLMLDMGDTVESVAKDTGFSTTTIRRRVKLLELDPEKFKASEARGATLFDYMELDKVDDPKTKNKLLGKIGTPDFKAELKKAVDRERQEKNMAKYVGAVSEFATEYTGDNVWSGYRQTKYYSTDKVEEVERPKDADTREYVYTASRWGITLYAKKEEAGSDSAEDAEAKRMAEERKRKEAILSDANERAYNLRLEFVKGVSVQTIKKNISAVVAAMIWIGVDRTCDICEEDLEELFGANFDCDNDEFTMEDAAALTKSPEKSLFLATYAFFDDREDRSYFSWRLEHVGSDALDNLYSLLTKLGYEMSSEEKALQDGSFSFEEAAEE